MARATISLPLPDGPVINTDALLGATWRTTPRISTIERLSPISRLSTLALASSGGVHAIVMPDDPFPTNARH
jgi:hypothetical protein